MGAFVSTQHQLGRNTYSSKNQGHIQYVLYTDRLPTVLCTLRHNLTLGNENAACYL